MYIVASETTLLFLILLVYLVRFVFQEDLDYEQTCSRSPPMKKRVTNGMSYPQLHSPDPGHDHKAMVETQFPNSFSIAELLKAGKLVRPKMQNKVVLTLEKFDVTSGEWKVEKPIEVLVETEKFSSGGFRDAFKAVSCSDSDMMWVVKTYNPKAKDSIETALNTTVENHTRKQVQMHAAARAITKKFELKVPIEFGESFNYNHTFFTLYDDNPATVEEFVPGAFVKYVNNNGDCCNPPAACSAGYKDIFAKAQCLVHFSYVSSNEKLMLLDIQGARYMLYDPEIATSDLFTDTNEVYFCCGNLSTAAIKEFKKNHACNKYCRMLELEAFPNRLSSKSIMNRIFNCMSGMSSSFSNLFC